MFNRDFFKYDPNEHIGYYNGVIVPSVTQLVDILYPMDSDIPEERIKNAAERGTEIHSLCETLNSYFDNAHDYNHNLKEVINIAKNLSEKDGRQELIDYVSILSAYKLRPFDYEELIFLLDENGDLICYGHYDFTAMAEEDNILFIEGRLNLFDIKTTSLFNKAKVSFQESIYATAYEQSSKNIIDNIYGLWLRDGAKIIPLERKDNAYVISLCKGLRDIWYDRRKD